MIKLNSNTFHSNGLLINQEIYVRTIQNCGIGNSVYKTELDANGNEIQRKYIKYIISYKSWLKSEYEKVDANGNMLEDKAPNIKIDELKNYIEILIPAEYDVSSYVKFEDLYKIFNEQFMQYFVLNNIIPANSYTIL